MNDEKYKEIANNFAEVLKQKYSEFLNSHDEWKKEMSNRVCQLKMEGAGEFCAWILEDYFVIKKSEVIEEYNKIKNLTEELDPTNCWLDDLILYQALLSYFEAFFDKENFK